MPDIDFFNHDNPQAEAPAISAEYADYIRETAAKIERDNPNNSAMLEHAAQLRRDIEGVAPPIPTDPRSTVQQRHDARFGITPRTADQYPGIPEEHRAFAAALQLPPDQARVVTNDLGTNKALDPVEGSQLFGERYPEMVKQAQYALDRAPGGKKATDLPAWSLGMLSAWGAHLKRHQQSCPK
jgi:hypothetical protein